MTGRQHEGLEAAKINWCKRANILVFFPPSNKLNIDLTWMWSFAVRFVLIGSTVLDYTKSTDFIFFIIPFGHICAADNSSILSKYAQQLEVNLIYVFNKHSVCEVVGGAGINHFFIFEFWMKWKTFCQCLSTVWTCWRFPVLVRVGANLCESNGSGAVVWRALPGTRWRERVFTGGSSSGRNIHSDGQRKQSIWAKEAASFRG